MAMVGKRIARPPAFSIAPASAPASSRGRVTTMPRPASALFSTEQGKDRRGALRAQILGDAAAKRFRIAAVPGLLGAQHAPAVFGGDQRAKLDLAIRQFSIGAERQGAAAAEGKADRALGTHAGSARAVGERRNQRQYVGAAAHAFDAHRALSRRGQARFGLEALADALAETEPDQPRHGEHD